MTNRLLRKIKIELNILEGSTGIKARNKEYYKYFFMFSSIYSLVKYIEKKEKISPELFSCSRIVRVNLRDRIITPLIDFNLFSFIDRNNLNNTIKMSLEYGGIGNTGSPVVNGIKFEVRTSEKNHSGSSHIHISDHRNRYGVSISLDGSFKILEGEKNWEERYSKSERKEIKKTIENYGESFKKFYFDVEHGINPEPVYYVFDGVKCRLGHIDCRCL